MNRINHKQKEVINFFQTQLKFWENTNDIESPTHLGDIKEFLYQINTVLTTQENNDIKQIAESIYFYIKSLKLSK